MDTAITLDSLVVVSSDQVSCALEDEVAIVHVKDGVYYGLDPVGARIWELIRTPQRVRSIRDTLLAEYQVEPERCESDLFQLLRDLRAAGLVDVSDGEPR
jgi:hypothetical protein